jgi:hypothetical protein
MSSDTWDTFCLVALGIGLCSIGPIALLTGCEESSYSVQEVQYGPCSHSDECGWGLDCIAADYGGDEGYCTQTCYRTADADIVAGSCPYVEACGSGCCSINYTISGGAYGYCVPYP